MYLFFVLSFRTLSEAEGAGICFYRNPIARGSFS